MSAPGPAKISAHTPTVKGHPLVWALGLGFLLFIIYLSNCRLIPAADAVPARYLPVSVVHERNLDFNEFPQLYEEVNSYFLVKRGDRYLSKYPVLPGIMAAPVHLAAHLFSPDPDSDASLMTQEKWAASLFAALSAVFVFLAAARLAGLRSALVVTLIYGLATTTFSTDSQALWQHGPSKLFLAISVYLLVRGLETPWLAGLSGAGMGLAVMARPSNALIVIAVGIYLLVKQRRQVPLYILSGLPFLALLAWIHAEYGALFGPYANHQTMRDWRGSIPLTFLAHLFNPNRGLLVYSPVLVFAFWGMWKKIRERDALYILFSAAILLHMALVSRFVIWWAGWAYGPRMLSDVMVFFALLMIPFVERLFASRSRPAAAAFIFLALLSTAIHAGNVYSTRPWDWHDNPKLEWNTSRLNDLRDGQIASIFRDRPLIIPFDQIGIRIGLDNREIAAHIHRQQNISDLDATYKRAKRLPAGEPASVSTELTLEPGTYALTLRARAAAEKAVLAGGFSAVDGEGKILGELDLKAVPGRNDYEEMQTRFALEPAAAAKPVAFAFHSTGEAEVFLDHFTVKKIGN